MIDSLTWRAGFAAGAGAATILAGTTPFSIGRAQGAPLKVGVILPLSGAQASIGQDCYRGVEIAAGIFKSLGLPEAKAYVDLSSVGNLVSASIPVALRGALDRGLVRPGSRVLLCGFGVGLSYGSVLLQY